MGENYHLSCEKLKEECGIFGIYNNEERYKAANIVYLGLHALQHRGQESAGICVNNNKKFKIHKGMGLVTNIFNTETLNFLEGNIAIGHVRYSTTGESTLSNAQPLLTHSIKGDLALAHNGNLVNSVALRAKIESLGSIFHSTLDTEIIAHLVARSLEDNIIDALIQTLYQIKGAYSLVAMTKDSLIAARDPYGFRPLSLGKLGKSYVISSETCAFDTIGATFIKDIEPGEIVIINKDGVKIHKFSDEKPNRFCIFEFIYFARPDSNFGGKNVYLARKEMGKQLAHQMKGIDADLVVPVPSSGIDAALGLSEELKIPYDNGILRNRYIGRTFIQPTQSIRDLKVRMKLNPIPDVIKGKSIILVDDSIVRGTTSKQIIKRLREAGAKKIHLAITSPPVAYPCYYGIDTSCYKELIAREKNIEEITKLIEADSLTYLNLEGLLKAVDNGKYKFCTACFTGNYPLKKNGEVII